MGCDAASTSSSSQAAPTSSSQESPKKIKKPNSSQEEQEILNDLFNVMDAVDFYDLGSSDTTSGGETGQIVAKKEPGAIVMDFSTSDDQMPSFDDLIS